MAIRVADDSNSGRENKAATTSSKVTLDVDGIQRFLVDRHVRDSDGQPLLHHLIPTLDEAGPRHSAAHSSDGHSSSSKQSSEEVSKQDSEDVRGSDFTEASSIPYYSHSIDTAPTVSEIRTLLSWQALGGHRLMDETAEAPNPSSTKLPCPFHFLRCQWECIGERDLWLAHSLGHFKAVRYGQDVPISPPCDNNCWYCGMRFQAENGHQSWRSMMDHVYGHHDQGQGVLPRPDFRLYHHLFGNKVIDLITYRELMDRRERDTTPAADGASTSECSEDERPVAVPEERRHRYTRR